MFAKEDRSTTWQSACIQLLLHRNPRVSSSTRSKKCSIYTPSLSSPPDDPSRRIPDILLDLPCALGWRLGGGKQRRRFATYIFAFSSLPRRVIAVAHLHRVLATGPCWHSFSQRHVTTSLHNSEARVLFRVSDWQSAAEARPKGSAPIGHQSINSDCHVLMEGSAHNVAL